MAVYIILFSLALFGLIWYRIRYARKTAWNVPSEDFPKEWRIVLLEKVPFYNALNYEEKSLFEFKIQEFLLNCHITPIDTTIDASDKLLVASSAIIPIFAFPDWKYFNLQEVLVYPDSFNNKFGSGGKDDNILGMVGTGYMDGKMILSKQALQEGFRNETDKRNTAIHEFVHLIDKSDGSVDGLPAVLLDKQYSLPWFDLIRKKIREIRDFKSDIDLYGGTSEEEFFSVISEYFFEQPKLLQRKNPELYALLEKIFKQKMNARVLRKNRHKTRRNDPCPCNSGLKFKECCGKK
ncbi:Protein MtfA [bioreactor metagenome]|uniref:Protein MtfA n=1 Tax=bioreactor metagenome TaxID=1076179 RepID=A0A644XNQ4_9ZZZZ